MRDYLTGNIRTSNTRRTGFRFVRGTHGGQYVRDREGTDIAPAALSARAEIRVALGVVTCHGAAQPRSNWRNSVDVL